MDQVFLFTILLNHIQASLGFERPVFLRDWPSFLTSSAAEQADGTLADRSELFVAGIELGDGFPSMTEKGQAISAGILLSDRDWAILNGMILGNRSSARRFDEPCREPGPNRFRDCAFVFR
jgi:hypothetical protein